MAIDVNMADAAAARREARRRRILENSSNRLQLISGKSVEDSSKDSLKKFAAAERYSGDSQTTDDTASEQFASNNGVIVTESESHIWTTLPSQEFVETGHIQAGDNQSSYDFARVSPTEEKPTVWEKFIASKYDIIVLSSLIQIVYSFSILTFESTYFFLPLIVYTVTKLLWTKPQNNNFANAILLLTGIPADRANRIMKAVCFFGTISQDISLYLFTTICVQALCIFLNDNLIT